MTPEEIRSLYAYDRWATSRSLDAASRLSPEQFTRPLGSSFSSVRDTLVHLVGAEWCWLERWRGASPKTGWIAGDFPDLAGIKRRWEDTLKELEEFLEHVTEEKLKKEVAYLNLQGEPNRHPLWQQMVHRVNHSTYHRGQLTTLLRQLGASPVATDFLIFCESTASQSPSSSSR